MKYPGLNSVQHRVCSWPPFRNHHVEPLHTLQKLVNLRCLHLKIRRKSQYQIPRGIFESLGNGGRFSEALCVFYNSKLFAAISQRFQILICFLKISIDNKNEFQVESSYRQRLLEVIVYFGHVIVALGYWNNCGQ